MAQSGWTRSEVLNVPNMISLARLLSGPPIAAMIVYELWAPALCCLAVSSASDWLDGHLARRWGQGSRLGSYLDPLADKVLIGSTIAALSIEVLAPLLLDTLLFILLLLELAEHYTVACVAIPTCISA